jgi:hypothetical protein
MASPAISARQSLGAEIPFLEVFGRASDNFWVVSVSHHTLSGQHTLSLWIGESDSPGDVAMPRKRASGEP